MNDCLGVGVGGDYLGKRVEKGDITREEAEMFRKWDKLSGEALQKAYAKWEAKNPIIKRK